MLDPLFPLLRLSLFDKPISSDEITEGLDWEQLIKTASKQTVLGLLADAASRLDERLRPPTHITQILQQFTLRNYSIHRIMNQTVADVVSYYDKHGIRSVLLKGQGIAQCYPNPYLRQCGDIDLFVGEKNYERACQLAQANDTFDTDSANETDMHYSFKKGIVSVEVHHMVSHIGPLWLRPRLQRVLTNPIESGEGLDRINVSGVEVNVPNANTNAFYIFFHLWHHFLIGGVGLRQLCDWAMVLHKFSADIDRKRLYDDLKALRLLKSWKAFGCIAVDYLGLPAEEMPFYDPDMREEAKKALYLIEKGGNFGQHSALVQKRSKHSNVLIRKATSLYMLLSEAKYKATFGCAETLCVVVRCVKKNLRKL